MSTRVTRLLRLVAFAAAVTIISIAGSAALTNVSAAGEAEDCLSCHGQADYKTMGVFVDQTKFSKTPHSDLGCSSCHSGITGYPHASGGENAAANTAVFKQEAATSCSSCHNEATGSFQQSIHSDMGLDCASCHGDVHTILRSSEPKSATYRKNVPATCGQCHEGKVTKSYEESYHGIAVKLGSSTAANCASCHGSHGIVAAQSPGSPVAKANVPETCAKCHGTAGAKLALGEEHAVVKNEGWGKPLYFTSKFFTWLTIITMTLLILHIELELLHRLRAGKK